MFDNSTDRLLYARNELMDRGAHDIFDVKDVLLLHIFEQLQDLTQALHELTDTQGTITAGVPAVKSSD